MSASYAGGFQDAAGTAVRCPYCRARLERRFDVGLRGELVEIVQQCLCPEARRLAGICRDCRRPVEGMVGRALRCAEHKRAAKRRQEREHLDRGDNRERKNARWRKKYHAKDSWQRAQRRRRKREWARAHPDKKQGQRIRYMLRHPDKVLAQQERHSNANRPDRAVARRRWAHENQTVYVGKDLVPTCAICGAEVPWSGRGRPHKHCESCDPKSWGRDQSKGRRTRADVAA